jgi:anti-sigma factor RsiW
MTWFELHLSDEALLLFSGNESSPRRRLRVTRHLESCERCRSRLARLDRMFVEVFELRGADEPLPPAAPARARGRRSRRADQRVDASRSTFRPCDGDS